MTTWKRMRCQFSVTVACLLACLACTTSAHADITAVVKDGTLDITGDPANVDQGSFFPDRITLSGDLTENILLSGTLQKTFSRAGISAIVITAPQGLVSLESFEFDGEIAIDVVTGGRCELLGVDLKGDIAFSGSAGRIVVAYRGAIIDGNVAIEGGPGADQFGPSEFGGFVVVSGNMNIDGGPGNDSIRLEDAFVGGETLVSLGQSTGGQPSSLDKDLFDLRFSLLAGDVMIAGDEGDDDVLVFLTEIRGDFLIDMGNGADRVSFFGLLVSEEPIVFVDGGNGNSDQLNLNGFPLVPEESAGFETINP